MAQARRAAISSAVKRSPWQPGHRPPPGTHQHNTKCAVEVVLTRDTYLGWEGRGGGVGGKAKCASEANLSTAESTCKRPLEHPHISETADQHWLDFNFA